MNLQRYPEAIARSAYLVNAISSKIAAIRIEIARIEGQASAAVSLDENLKEDHHRKSVRFNILQSDEEYQNLQNDLIQMIESKANAQTTLERVCNEFAVAKAEAKAVLGRQKTLTWPDTAAIAILATSLLVLLFAPATNRAVQNVAVPRVSLSSPTPDLPF